MKKNSIDIQINGLNGNYDHDMKILTNSLSSLVNAIYKHYKITKNQYITYKKDVDLWENVGIIDKSIDLDQ